jgi:hypothetical protein
VYEIIVHVITFYKPVKIRMIMKNMKLKALALAVATVGFFAFKSLEPGSIKGTVTPPEGAARVWAISNTDTLKAAVEKGAFVIPNVKAGTYRLIIEANPPFKNTAKDGIAVTDGQATDVGEIKLQQ